MLDTQAILSEIDVPTLLSELKVEYQRTETCALMHCPLGTHADANPSCLFFWDTKRFDCKSCGEKGDAISFTARLLKKERHETALWLVKRFNVKFKVVVSPIRVREWHDALMANSRFKAVCTERKGLCEEALSNFQIGLDGDRIIIPIPDREGSFVNVRRYNPFAGKRDDKYSNLREAASTKELFPYASLRENTIILTEGEFKAILLITLPFPPIQTSSRLPLRWY